MKTRVGLIGLVLGLLASDPALADKDRDKKVAAEDVRALVTSGELMPLDEILRRNEAHIGGRVIDLHLERKRGSYIYDIKVLQLDGRYAKVEVDARTGMLLPRDK